VKKLTKYRAKGRAMVEFEGGLMLTFWK
jgi:hypothetical protein